MKLRVSASKYRQALTLAETLLVIIIVFVLLAMLMPVVSRPKTSHLARARVEMADLVNAIESYENEYNHPPLASDTTNEDITLGIKQAELKGAQSISGTRLVETNSGLMIVLMDFNCGINTNHQLNPKQIKFLNARLSGNTNSSGVGIDFQYRDPWGNPYVISLDANQDGMVRDAFYSYPSMFSAKLPTCLIKTNGLFQLRGKVMVWSRGPDGKINFTVPANNGVNKDNVISWE